MNESLSTYLVMGFGVLVTVLCAWSAARPDSLADWAARLVGKPWSVPMIAAIRLLLGAALLEAASGSRHPLVLTVLGWLAIAGAVFVVVAGRQRVGKILHWAMAMPLLMLRLWSGFGVAFGIFLIWSVN